MKESPINSNSPAGASVAPNPGQPDNTAEQLQSVTGQPHILKTQVYNQPPSKSVQQRDITPSEIATTLPPALQALQNQYRQQQADVDCAYVTYGLLNAWQNKQGLTGQFNIVYCEQDGTEIPIDPGQGKQAPPALLQQYRTLNKQLSEHQQPIAYGIGIALQQAQVQLQRTAQQIITTALQLQQQGQLVLLPQQYHQLLPQPVMPVPCISLPALLTLQDTPLPAPGQPVIMPALPSGCAMPTGGYLPQGLPPLQQHWVPWPGGVTQPPIMPTAPGLYGMPVPYQAGYSFCNPVNLYQPWLIMLYRYSDQPLANLLSLVAGQLVFPRLDSATVQPVPINVSPGRVPPIAATTVTTDDGVGQSTQPASEQSTNQQSGSAQQGQKPSVTNQPKAHPASTLIPLPSSTLSADSDFEYIDKTTLAVTAAQCLNDLYVLLPKWFEARREESVEQENSSYLMQLWHRFFPKENISDQLAKQIHGHLAILPVQDAVQASINFDVLAKHLLLITPALNHSNTTDGVKSSDGSESSALFADVDSLTARYGELKAILNKLVGILPADEHDNMRAFIDKVQASLTSTYVNQQISKWPKAFTITAKDGPLKEHFQEYKKGVVGDTQKLLNTKAIDEQFRLDIERGQPIQILKSNGAIAFDSRQCKTKPSGDTKAKEHSENCARQINSLCKQCLPNSTEVDEKCKQLEIICKEFSTQGTFAGLTSVITDYIMEFFPVAQFTPHTPQAETENTTRFTPLKNGKLQVDLVLTFSELGVVPVGYDSLPIPGMEVTTSLIIDPNDLGSRTIDTIHVKILPAKE